MRWQHERASSGGSQSTAWPTGGPFVLALATWDEALSQCLHRFHVDGVRSSMRPYEVECAVLDHVPEAHVGLWVRLCVRGLGDLG